MLCFGPVDAGLLLSSEEREPEAAGEPDSEGGEELDTSAGNGEEGENVWEWGEGRRE